MENQKQTHGWALDYSWAYEDNWDVNSDVLLEGRFSLALENNIYRTLEEVLNIYEFDLLHVDKKARKVHYEGGMFCYLEKNKKYCSVFIHSCGEDAFDCISYYSQVIEEKLLKKNQNIKVQWIKHKHNRKNRLLSL